jgi:hypothetical protein
MREDDRRTDITKLVVAFCNFGNAPKQEITPTRLKSRERDWRQSMCIECVLFSDVTYE